MRKRLEKMKREKYLYREHPVIELKSPIRLESTVKLIEVNEGNLSKSQRNKFSIVTSTSATEYFYIK